MRYVFLFGFILFYVFFDSFNFSQFLKEFQDEIRSTIAELNSVADPRKR
jgi:hypothetical protein